MTERPHVVGVDRRIRGTKLAPDIIGTKVRPDRISYSFHCNCCLLHAINLVLNYSQSERIYIQLLRTQSNFREQQICFQDPGCGFLLRKMRGCEVSMIFSSGLGYTYL